MRLVSFTHAGSTRAGVLTESGDIADIGAPMTELLANGTLIERAKKALAGGTTIPATRAVIEAPVPKPPKVLAIGLNYRDHAQEASQPIPQRPVVFAKLSAATLQRVDTYLDAPHQRCCSVEKNGLKTCYVR